MAVKDVMTVKEGETSNTVKHRDGRVYAEVSAKLTSDDVSKASAAVQKVDKMDLPSGVDVSMGGVTKDIEESFKQLGLAMLARLPLYTSFLSLHLAVPLHHSQFYSRYHLQLSELLLPY